MDAPKLTGVKKRQQIEQANKTMFLWIIAASVAVAVCLVLAQFMVRQFVYNSKVIGEKAKAQQILDRNIDSVDSLKQEVNKLIANNELTALRVSPSDTALQVIIDALPTSDDRAGLATSLQQVILARSGITIDSISVTGQSISSDATATATTNVSTPIEIPFNITVVGDYAKLTQTITDLERSIRPISVDVIDVQGSGSTLRATISAKTFYLPPKSVEVQKKGI